MMDASQQSAPCYKSEDDGLSLVDMLGILIKRKQIVLGFLIIVPLLATVAYVLSPVEAEYTSAVTIQVGKVPQFGNLEETVVLMRRLKLQYPFIDSIEAGKEGANSMLTIMVRSAQESEAVRNLKEVLDQLLKEHNEKFLGAIANLQLKQEIIRRQINSIHTQLADITSSFNATRKKDPSQAVFLVLEKGQLLKELPALEEAAINLKSSVSEPTSLQTKVIVGPTISNSSAKPNFRMLMVLSVLLGLMLGIVGVFLAEFVVRVKTRTVQDK